MFYLDMILKILGIASLVTFMTIFIWGFVVFNSIYSQLKYTNYILEKISHILNISCIDMQAKAKEKNIKNINTPRETATETINNTDVN